MSDLRKYVQMQPKQLAGSGAVLGATSIVINDFTDIGGNNLTMSDFGAKGWMTLEPGSYAQEEQISFTGITVNGNGTSTLTGVRACCSKRLTPNSGGWLRATLAAPPRRLQHCRLLRRFRQPERRRDDHRHLDLHQHRLPAHGRFRHLRRWH